MHARVLPSRLREVKVSFVGHDGEPDLTLEMPACGGPAASPADSKQESTDYRDRAHLERHYREHNPDKLWTMERMLS